MTDIPECFICKYFNKTIQQCTKHNEISKIIINGDKCNDYKYKDAK